MLYGYFHCSRDNAPDWNDVWTDAVVPYDGAERRDDVNSSVMMALPRFIYFVLNTNPYIYIFSFLLYLIRISLLSLRWFRKDCVNCCNVALVEGSSVVLIACLSALYVSDVCQYTVARLSVLYVSDVYRLLVLAWCMWVTYIDIWLLTMRVGPSTNNCGLYLGGARIESRPERVVKTEVLVGLSVRQENCLDVPQIWPGTFPSRFLPNYYYSS